MTINIETLYAVRTALYRGKIIASSSFPAYKGRSFPLRQLMNDSFVCRGKVEIKSVSYFSATYTYKGNWLEVHSAHRTETCLNEVVFIIQMPIQSRCSHCKRNWCSSLDTSTPVTDSDRKKNQIILQCAIVAWITSVRVVVFSIPLKWEHVNDANYHLYDPF